MDTFSPLFQDRIEHQIADAADFFNVLNGDSLTSIRLNAFKSSGAALLPLGTAVPWNKQGLILNERPSFMLDVNYHAGLYYPMEAASMFLNHVLSSFYAADDAIDVLDLCAAPGGKSLMMSDYFNQALLVSNEIDKNRVHVLKENAIRWGTENHIVIQSDAQKLRKSKLLFDLILIDAPCSGEGLFRKDKKSRSEWTPERASGCAARQQSILDDAVLLLKPGGCIVYSTCTYNADENMNRIVDMHKRHHFTSLPIPVPSEWNIQELNEHPCFGYQFWPHRSVGEGFFISILRSPHAEGFNSYAHRTKKTKSNRFPYLKEYNFDNHLIQQFDTKYFALTEKESQFTSALSRCGNIIKKGIFLGESKGNDFIPSYDFAMNKRALVFQNKLELSETDALLYLRGNALNRCAPKGPILLTYNGLAVGMGKSNGSRINNLHPKHLRIPPL